MRPELELVQQWLQRAQSDLNVAQASLELQRPELAAVCFHCQQAVEKSLKGFLSQQGVEFEWSHALKYLLGLCAGQDKSFEQFLESAVPLAEYAVTFRYPSDEPDPTIEQAQDALAVARQVWQYVLERLPSETHPDDSEGGSRK